jgi:hypothetical protein
MMSSGMCHRVAHVRPDVSQERIASIIRVILLTLTRRSVLQLLVTDNVIPT